MAACVCARRRCCCCAAGWTGAACPLCTLARHLERPRIDEEAALVWLPEMSQAAVNTTMREIHMQLRALGEGLHAEHRLRLDLPERTRPASRARGTRRPRCASPPPVSARRRQANSAARCSACRRLPTPAARRCSGGLRLLPLGRFYEGGDGRLSRHRRYLARPGEAGVAAKPARRSQLALPEAVGPCFPSSPAASRASRWR